MIFHFVTPTITIIVLQQTRHEYYLYIVDSPNTLFETIPVICIVEILTEANFSI